MLSLSRQTAPTQTNSSAQSVALGAYTLETHGSAASLDLVLVSSGTEVSLITAVAKELHSKHGLAVRTVSMPCWELFDEQSEEYQLSVFPPGVAVMSVEASGTHGWSKYSHAAFGLTTFGLSAPLKDIYAHFGFTVPNLVEKAQEVVSFYTKAGVKPQSLIHKPKFAAIAGFH